MKLFPQRIQHIATDFSNYQLLIVLRILKNALASMASKNSMKYFPLYLCVRCPISLSFQSLPLSQTGMSSISYIMDIYKFCTISTEMPTYYDYYILLQTHANSEQMLISYMNVPGKAL